MGLPIEQHIALVPAALQPSVALWFERFAERHGEPAISDEVATRVARIVACSEFAGIVLLREWSWFVANVAQFETVGDDQDLQQFVRDFAGTDSGLDERKSKLRVFRNRCLLRVLWREVHGLADLDETLYRLSRIADRLLYAATCAAEQELSARFGQMRNAVGDVVPLVVLGMGKLGGAELNFSSDIDLIFCYPESGHTDGNRHVSAQEYFGRLALKVIELLDEVTADGFVFRVDTRLRPFGDSGPPVVSFAALESYLLQHGRDWERYAYVKARVVGKTPPADVIDDLFANLIRPFVYRRYLDYGVFESLREMHSMIAIQVRRKELVNNLKLGPGGIREAEFVVQALQLVRGGTEPDLQGRELQQVLPRLVGDGGLNAQDAKDLRCAYRFLRRLENFVQAIQDHQTHDLPTNKIDRERLCFALNYANWEELSTALGKHRFTISRLFAAIAFRDEPPDSSTAQEFRRLWEMNADAAEWRDVLATVVKVDAAEIADQITAFMNAAPTKKADATSYDRLQRFIPTLILCVIEANRPLIALTRTLSVIERILRRSAYLSLLNENHGALSRLVDLCANNLTIAEQLARFPVLLDELLDPSTYSGSVSKSDLANELQQKLANSGAEDSEQTMQTIAQFQRATLFRIAISDFSGSLPIMKVSDALTWLAETVLDETLRVVWGDLKRGHGVPKFTQNGIEQEAGFGVIGYGKLGGLELSYASDLDIVFVHNSSGTQQSTDGDKPLENAVFFARLARRLVHFLTTRTESGELYEVDTRLRPDGRSGLLVTSLQAFERYQDENAWTWEHQALLRARAIAGDPGVLAEFDRIRQETLLHRVNRAALHKEVAVMRRRMRTELDRSSDAAFDLKHGHGGIGDIEFLVQYLVLRKAGSHPELIRHTDNIRQLDALIEAKLLDASTGLRLQDTYRRYRSYVHHLVLDGRPKRIASHQFEAERNFVRELWQEWLG